MLTRLGARLRLRARPNALRAAGSTSPTPGGGKGGDDDDGGGGSGGDGGGGGGGGGGGLRDLPSALKRKVGMMTASQFILNAGIGVVIPVLPLFATELGCGALGLGAIVSAPALSRLALNMRMGRLCDTKGRKPLMIGGTLVLAAASVSTGFAGSLATVLPARLLVGAGSAASLAGAQAYMADITAAVPGQRGKILGVYHSAIVAAFAGGPALGGFVAEAYGPQAAFMVVGGAASCCALGYTLLPETQGGAAREEAEAAGAARDADKTKGSLSLELLRRSDQQAIVAATMAVNAGYAAAVTILPLHAADVWGAGAQQLGVMFSVFSLFGLAGAPLGGWIADKYGRTVVVGPALALVGAGAGATAMAGSQESMLAAIVVWGLGNSLISPGLNAFAADRAPAKIRAEALSLQRQAADVAFLVAPLGLGLLSQCTDNVTALGLFSVYAVGSAAVFAARTRGIAGSEGVEEGYEDDEKRAPGDGGGAAGATAGGSKPAPPAA
jgi:MFS family permease